MPTDILTQAGTVLASALVASFAYYAAKRRGTDEEFKPEKMAVTIVAAFVVAAVLFATGRATNQDDVLAQLALFVGPVTIWLQNLVDRYRSREYGSGARR